MKKRAFISLLVLSVVVFSCKKDDPKTTRDILMGKWSLVTYKWNDHENGVDHYDSSIFASGLYYTEFKNNGTVISSSSFTTTRDTSVYKLIDGKILVTDNRDTGYINTISATQLQIYYKEIYQNGDYREAWDYYKKY